MAIVFPVELQELDVQGVQLFSTRQLEKILGFEVGDTLEEQVIVEGSQRLLEAYRDRGYLKAKLARWMEERVLHLHVDEGSLYTVGSIEIEGNRFFSGDYILQDFELRQGRVFTQSLLEGDIDRLLNKYEDNGFPFCTVKPSDFRLDEVQSQMDFVLTIDEGFLTRVSNVETDGNVRTKDWAILRELRIREQEIYSRTRIENGLRRLNQLDVLEVRDYDLRVPRDGWVDVIVRVEEKKSNSMEGVIGWAPREDQLTGLVNLRADNLFGTLRSFHFQWMRRNPLSSYLQAQYREPWLLGTPLIGEVNAEVVVEDTSYTVHSVSVHLFSKILHPFIFGAGVGADRVTALTASIPNSDQLSLTLHSAIDTRDSHSTPRRGIFYKISTKYGLKSDYSSAHFADERETKSYVTRTQFSMSNFVPVKGNVVYIGIGGGRLSSAGSSSVWEQFKLGGAATVRGYKEEQFMAPQVGWANLEYRFILDDSGWISPFFDIGQYRKSTTQWIYGWGLGVGLTSRLGLIKIYYGLGREDSFGAGKIHFGLSTSF